MTKAQYIGYHQGLGLNIRNETAHAINAFGDRRITALALQSILYLVTVLNRHKEVD